MKKKLVFLALPFALFACAEVAKTPVPTSGSRSDASVVLSYETNPYEIVTDVDWDAAQKAANARCEVWGYSEADPFAGTVTTCQGGFDMYGNCTSSLVSKTYQCMGRG